MVIVSNFLNGASAGVEEVVYKEEHAFIESILLVQLVKH